MKTDWKALRKALQSRCKGYCEVCGHALPEEWAAHHRKLRKHGGSDELSNLLALHHMCHNLGTHSVHLNPKTSYEKGYLVKSWDNPTTTPILLHGLKYTLLDNLGNYKEMP